MVTHKTGKDSINTDVNEIASKIQMWMQLVKVNFAINFLVLLPVSLCWLFIYKLKRYIVKCLL